MSVTLMAQVWKMDLPATEKLVLLALADCANDEGVAWPSVSGAGRSRLPLCDKCSLSERAVQGALRRLEMSGHIERHERPGKSTVYRVKPQTLPLLEPLDPRTKCTPAADAPPQQVRETPAAGADEPSRNHHIPPPPNGGPPRGPAPDALPKVGKGCRLPDGWAPPPIGELPEVTRGIVSGWPDGAYAFQAEQFRAHWAAEKGPRAVKLDWGKAWVMWLGRGSADVNRLAKQGQAFVPAKAASVAMAEDGCERAATIKRRLADDMPEASWRQWFGPLRFEIDGPRLVIRGALPFAKDWLTRNMGAELDRAARPLTVHWVLERGPAAKREAARGQQAAA